MAIIPAPTSAPASVETAITRWRKRTTGTTGSAARRSTSKPLQRAKGDERADAAREPAGHRAGEEDGDAGEQHRLATVEVGELAVERHRDRRGQEIGGEDPGIEVDAAQIADHGGHGGG